MVTTAVIGDVGGHVGHLVDCLSALGVRDGVWPDGLHVVQLGDLFGGGTGDVEVARLVQPFLYAGRWTQLVGNWELAAVGGPEVSAGDGRRAHPDAVALFARWSGAGLVRYAAAVRSRSGRTAVVTHAGITRSWATSVGLDDDPAAAVSEVNAAPVQRLHRGGEMMGDTSNPPSPMWASIPELWRSWLSPGSPWTQIHGHSRARDYRDGGWTPWVPKELRVHAHLEDAARRVRWQPAGHAHPLWSIDAGLSDRAPRGALRALVVHGD